jgi:hypothetical protein
MTGGYQPVALARQHLPPEDWTEYIWCYPIGQGCLAPAPDQHRLPCADPTAVPTGGLILPTGADWSRLEPTGRRGIRALGFGGALAPPAGRLPLSGPSTSRLLEGPLDQAPAGGAPRPVLEALELPDHWSLRACSCCLTGHCYTHSTRHYWQQCFYSVRNITCGGVV